MIYSTYYYLKKKLNALSHEAASATRSAPKDTSESCSVLL